MKQFRINSLKMLLVMTIMSSFLTAGPALANFGDGISINFSLDTRLNVPPVDGWQIVTYQGNTLNEDLVIDNDGNVWLFYLRGEGSGQSVYMKILDSQGFVIKSEAPIATATTYLSPEKQTIRAILNTVTGQVWVAIQSDLGLDSKGMFLVFDADGNQVDAQYLPGGAAYFPKMACDQSGNMWFVWQTSSTSEANSTGLYYKYAKNGDPIFGEAKKISQIGYTSWTDIVIDKQNHIWFIWDRDEHVTLTRVIDTDENELFGETIRGVPLPVGERFHFNQQRMAVATGNRVWLLAKKQNLDAQKLLVIGVDSQLKAEITDVKNCSFAVNERGNVEVIRHNNMNYQTAEFEKASGRGVSQPLWQTKFDDTAEFIQNSIAYNPGFNTMKAFLVQTDTSVTRVFLEEILYLPDIYVTPDSVSFDTVKIFDERTELVWIDNLGNADLEITNVTTDNSLYTPLQTTLTLTPGERGSLSVKVIPDVQEQSVDGIMTFFSNDPDEPTTLVKLHTWARKPLDQKIGVNPDSLDFGVVQTNSFQLLNVVVQNLGEATLNVDQLEFTHTDFSTTPDTLVVRPGSSRTVTVKYAPSSAGEVSGLLKIYSDDPYHRLTNVVLIGEGRDPVPQQIVWEPDTLDFGTIAMNQQQTLTVSVHNPGELPLVISDITVALSVFEPTANSMTLNGGESNTFDVRFHPTAAGVYSSILVLESNDAVNPAVQIHLQGVALKQNRSHIDVSTDSVYFGQVQIGDSRPIRIQVENQGDLQLEVTDILSSGSAFSPDVTSLSLAPAENAWIEISFQPAELRDYNEALTLVSNDPEKPVFEVKLTGEGVLNNPPQLWVEPLAITYDTTVLNNSQIKYLQVTNQGQELLQIERMFVTSTEFQTDESAFNLGAGQTQYVSVTFQPTQARETIAEVVILSNDAANASYTVLLRGVGRMPLEQQIIVGQENLSFGAVAVGQQLTANLLVKNSGELPLNIARIQSSQPQFVPDFSATDLIPDQIIYIPITFTPNSTGAFSANLSVFSDDPESPETIVTVTGTGRSLNAPEITVNSDEMDYGVIALTQSAEKSL
ncbi:choice-of-anchor D domain-containing protein, partial [bacterium]|nr:choice-of-anchor D domain-containing protein [bacterium]